MIGLRGRLLSTSFAQDVLPTIDGAIRPAAATRRAIEQWAELRRQSFGPASGARAVADGVAVPLLRILGYTAIRRVDESPTIHLEARAEGHPALPVLVVAWSDELSSARRAAILSAIAADARWCFCINGRALWIVDAHRTWAREHLEFDADALGQDEALQDTLWFVARAESLLAVPSLLERAVAQSSRHGVEVCRALGDGVLRSMQLLIDSLVGGRRSASREALFEQSLTIVYRILFLLFAEARGLVPVWHPVYRERYTIDTIVSGLVSGKAYRGVWAAIEAISRLAHAGCVAGELRVTAFNGRLFAPAHVTAFEGRRLDDRIAGEAVLAVSTIKSTSGRQRIHYRDLDVEQLGAVYEHVLEYQPGGVDDGSVTRNRDVRQATGTFYTPRQVTAWLVRQALAPLVEGRSAEDILRLRVLDPAMGSGAFLVAACRFLATAMEHALIDEGQWHPGDSTANERAGLRRLIAQRCLFGVDLNPTAVQLARLSLWLTTLASDKPLTFLDHHLLVGNSLVGASFEDVRRQPGGRIRRNARAGPLPLFDDEGLTDTLEGATRSRDLLMREPDDSADIVRDKERRLAAVQHPDGPLGRWRRVLDLWCAGWFTAGDVPLDRGLFTELTAQVLHGRCALPGTVVAPMLQRAQTAAERLRFFHWPAAFPEVLSPLATENRGRGFDAVIGNPPWDMLRGDSGGDAQREERRADARQMTDYVRESGVFRVESGAHLNRYSLFLERALQLTGTGSRIGFVLPAGLVTDVGAAPMRRHLFDAASVDTIVGLDNRARIFPIHRSVRFVLLTATRGLTTERIACRFGISNCDALDERGEAKTSAPFVLTRAFITRSSGEEDLGIPEIRTAADLRILEKVTATIPRAGSVEGWNVRFGRELNMTDDRGAFAPASGSATARAVLEGKQVEPFRVLLDRVRYELRAGATTRVPRLPRLAYRDVAGATNRLTLIAAVVPARAVTTHTLFCLKTPLPLDAQRVLCALLNSFVCNYLIRMRVSTHVTAALVAKLRLPIVHRGREFSRLLALEEALSGSREPVERMEEYAELQALAGRLYGLSAEEFQHVLSTFPLVGADTRAAALGSFTAGGT